MVTEDLSRFGTLDGNEGARDAPRSALSGVFPKKFVEGWLAAVEAFPVMVRGKR